MNTLVQIRKNLYYGKVDEKYIKLNELILIIEKPRYVIKKDKTVERVYEIEDVRIAVTDEGIDQMIAKLIELKNANEKDLK